METPMELIELKLRRLRGWFVAWFVTEGFIGIVASIGILESLGRLGLPGLNGETDGAGLGVTLSLVILAVLLALALWVFEALLVLRNWARVVLLAVAWISAVGAVTSFLGVGMLGMVSARFRGLNLEFLTLVSIFTNGLKLLFWGYVVATLQFDREVVERFHRSCFGRTPAESSQE
jgi:hypothetical protein